jgi:hypothetical protein
MSRSSLEQCSIHLPDLSARLPTNLYKRPKMRFEIDTGFTPKPAHLTAKLCLKIAPRPGGSQIDSVQCQK